MLTEPGQVAGKNIKLHRSISKMKCWQLITDMDHSVSMPVLVLLWKLSQFFKVSSGFVSVFKVNRQAILLKTREKLVEVFSAALFRWHVNLEWFAQHFNVEHVFDDAVMLTQWRAISRVTSFEINFPRSLLNFKSNSCRLLMWWAHLENSQRRLYWCWWTGRWCVEHTSKTVKGDSVGVGELVAGVLSTPRKQSKATLLVLVNWSLVWWAHLENSQRRLCWCWWTGHQTDDRKRNVAPHSERLPPREFTHTAPDRMAGDHWKGRADDESCARTYMQIANLFLTLLNCPWERVCVMIQKFEHLDKNWNNSKAKGVWG